MGFQVWLLFIVLLTTNDASNASDTSSNESCNKDVPCRLVTPNYHVRRADRNPFRRNKPPPCVNYEVLEPEVMAFINRTPLTLAEFGLSDISTDIEELRDIGKILLKGPVGPIRCGNITAQHWTRVENVINLVYNVTVGGEEQLFAFASPQFDNLEASDTLEGAVQSLQEDVEGFNSNYPGATAEAMPFLVQDFGDLLDSFNCSSSGSNCNLTRGEDKVVPLDDRWSIVARPSIEYEPGGLRRAINFKIIFAALRRLRRMYRLFIY
ncbi:uncharacterized protein [Branchiostoma lanceolatum]|uniref:uncharacterized protein n=1 Tax=Branchiostoma lanceolatum TaxID=7740 RepID=UPI00345456EB